jgi:hypothetical protein
MHNVKKSADTPPGGSFRVVAGILCEHGLGAKLTFRFAIQNLLISPLQTSALGGEILMHDDEAIRTFIGYPIHGGTPFED